MTTHFWLGGSIAKRALACPGSLQYKPSGSSAAADRGTLLHEAMTRLTTGELARVEHAVGMSASGQQITQRDARQALLPALRAVESWLDGRPAQYEVQVRFRSIRQAGGTADVLSEHGVADYKFGRMPVSVKRNEQMMFYAAAALECGALPKRSEYSLCIIQPEVKKTPMVDVVTHDELIDITARLKEAAANARSKKPRFAAGDHCLWCPARQTCRVRVESPFAALKAALYPTETKRKEVK
jgi:Protein of unknown function (DUF2800)